MITPRLSTRWQTSWGAIDDDGSAGPCSSLEPAPVIRGARFSGTVTGIADIGTVAPQKLSSTKIVPGLIARDD